ncbi:MAG: M48 family metallopeptidase [Anaerolineae bacterium]|nr:M48 family metallopeptidase [Anaerolineae bacterium]
MSKRRSARAGDAGLGQGVTPENEDPIAVEIVRDGRLRTRIHWEWHGDTVRVRVPRGVRQADVDRHVADIVAEVKRRRAQVRARADADLEAVAREISRKYFGGEVKWHSIRWVGNMQKRLGSCTTGGPTDGDIRISDKIRGWPDWVIEYVVAHELAHRVHPNHSAAFWEYLGRYPKTERARGFLQGVAFQSGEDAEEWL